MENFSTYQGLAFDALLISLLEDEGIAVSPQAAIDIQKILANTDVNNISFAKLKYKISPILSQNKEQQEEIHQIFDNLDKKFLKLTDTGSISPPQLPTRNPINDLIVILSILSLLVLAFGVWYFRIPPPCCQEPKVYVSHDSNIIINKPITFKAVLNDTTFSKNNYTIDWQIGEKYIKNKWQVEETFNKATNNFHKTGETYTVPQLTQVFAYLKNKEGIIVDTSENFIDVLCEEKPSVRIAKSTLTKKLNTELYFPVFTNISKDSTKYTYRWYVDNKLVSTKKELILEKRKFNVLRNTELTVMCNGVHCSVDKLSVSLRELPSINSRIVADGKPLEIIKTTNWKNIFIILSFFLIPLLISLFIFYLLRTKQVTYTPEQSGKEKPYSIEFKDQEFLIDDEAAVNSFADKLRKRQLSEVLKLNIHKTIHATLRAIGLPQLHFSQLTKPTEFVIFFDKEHNDSHLTHILEYLIRKLQREQVNLTVYTYYKEPLYLSNEKLNLIRIPVERVAALHAEAMLLIIGDSRNFVYPIKKTIKDWVSTKLKTWSIKILITPYAINDWDIKERLLSEAAFIIIPADMNAQASLDKIIFHQADRQRNLQIPFSYSARFLNLHTIEGLRNYLSDKNLFDWVCSLAVYPYTDWNLTLALGKAIENKLKSEGKQANLVNYTNLLKLGRISWLHDSSWKEDLRVEMLQVIENETEALARKTLIEQLDLIKDGIKNDSLIKREFDVTYTFNSFLLDIHQKDRNSALQKEPIIKDMLDKLHIDEANEIYHSKVENKTLLKDPYKYNESITLKDYLNESTKITKSKSRVKNILRYTISGCAYILLSLLTGYVLKNKTNFLEWQKTAPSTITFKTKNLTNQDKYGGFIVIDTLKKDFNVDTTIVFKNLLLKDTITYGKYKMYYWADSSDTHNLDSFKLNNTSYTLSLETLPLIPVKIEYPANNKAAAEVVASYLPGNFDVQKQESSAKNKDYKVYYYDKKYEAYANTCASILNNNLKKNIIVGDSTKSKSRTVPIGISVPEVSITWSPAVLPPSLTEIWHGETNNRLITINLEKKVLYYSTVDKNTYGTYYIDEVFIKNSIYKIITKSNQGYKLFFMKNITPTSYALSVCQQFFKTKEEIPQENSFSCGSYDNMTFYYENDKDRTYLPLNLDNFSLADILTSDMLNTPTIEVYYTNNTFLTNVDIKKIAKLYLNLSLRESKLNFKLNKTFLNNPFNRNYFQFINKPSFRILWIDDKPSNNLSLIEYFRKNNIIIDLAYSNKEGLEKLNSNIYAYIITDIAREKDEIGVQNKDKAGIEFTKIVNFPKQDIIIYSESNKKGVYSKELRENGIKNPDSYYNSDALRTFIMENIDKGNKTSFKQPTFPPQTCTSTIIGTDLYIIYFEEGENDFTDKSIEVLKVLVSYLEKNPNALVTMNCFSSDVENGSNISQQYGNKIKNYLGSKGLETSGILIKNYSSSKERCNNRVEIIVQNPITTPTPKKQILFVIDNAFYSEKSVKSIIKDLTNDFEVIRVESNSEALRELNSQGRNFQLVISDLHRKLEGNRAGIALLEQIRVKNKTIPFILYTSFISRLRINSSEKKELNQNGVTAIIENDFKGNELKKVVNGIFTPSKR